MREIEYEKYREKIRSMDMVFERITVLDAAMDEQELNQRIPILLEAVGEYTQSDRVYIFDWMSEVQDGYHNTFEWCKKGVQPQKECLQEVPLNCMPVWQERFLNGKSVMIRDVEEIKKKMPSEYILLKMQDIHSEIAVPIFSNHSLTGFIGLDNPEVSFLEISTKLMMDVGIHLSYVRENRRMLERLKEKRKKLEQSLQEIEKEKKLLEALCIDYNAVYYGDLLRDSIEPVKESNNRKEIASYSNSKKLSYAKRIQYYYDNCVIKESATDFMEKLSASYLMSHLISKERLCYRYRAYPNKKGQSYFEVQVARVHDHTGGFKIVMGYRYIDDVIANAEHTKHELIYKQSVVKALGEYYMSVLYVDLKKNTLQIAKADQEYKALFWKKEETISDFDEAMKIYTEHFVTPEEQKTVLMSLKRESLLRKLSEKNHFTMRHNCIEPDGTTFCVEVHVVKSPSEEAPDGVVIGFRNVEELVQKERQQMQKMSDALKQAERASAAKSNFLSRMSHDIRTPLNAIIGIIDMNDKYPEDVEFNKKNRAKEKLAAKYLLSLINDILEMSKLEDGKTTLQHEKFDILDLFKDTLALCKMRAEKMRITIESDMGENVKYRKLYGSPLHVRQIFMNLLSNAIKYNKIGGSVRCNSRMISESENQVRYEFTIQDTGVGMEQKFLKHIFEPFVQEDNNARSNYQGTGLGMAITKNLVDLMKGEISVESRKNIGTRVTVSLPFEMVKEEEEKQLGKSLTVEGMKVLLVEDNEINQEIARFMLENEGADVVCAQDGKEAVELFEESDEGEYDAILMDIMMPVMNGLEATREIRKTKRRDAKTVGIIALTANAFIEDKQKSKEAGMNEHLAKPLDIQKMLCTVAKYKRA